MAAAPEPLDAGLRPAEIDATVEWIAGIQLSTGMIPWFPGGHADPWNHVEAAMAMLLGGRRPEAERAFEWLAATQLPDGAWCQYYLAEGVEEPRRDPNVIAYVATGVWWHHLLTGDRGLLETLWPVVDRAIGYVLGLQLDNGPFLWSVDPDGVPGRFALLTSSASIYHSLRCALAIAGRMEIERPAWLRATKRVGQAVAQGPGGFEPKDAWAMDWYYPVLSGAIVGEAGRRHLAARWDDFVMEGLGVRCIVDNPWVTAAETSECAIALEAVGMIKEAESLAAWTRHLREDNGGYWTGCVHPQCVRYPGGERTTYTAAAVLLADHVLYGGTRASGLFRAEAFAAL